jgi:nitrite reductase (NADH) small subunit
MMTHRWLRVTPCDNIPVREGRAVMLGDREIAIFNLGERYLATDNRCPHRGGPLCDGIVTGGAVVCPLHGWKIDLETGRVERPAGEGDQRIETYPTRVEEGVIVVALPDGASQESFSEAGAPSASLCVPVSSKNDSRPHFQGS